MIKRGHVSSGNTPQKPPRKKVAPSVTSATGETGSRRTPKRLSFSKSASTSSNVSYGKIIYKQL